MYTPTNINLFGAVTPVAGTSDLALHTFLGVSWDVLLPYTILGLVLMAYSHNRLIRGQRALNKQQSQK